MKFTAMFRGAVLGGVLTALLFTVAGRMLGWDAWPWTWYSTFEGYLGRVLEWSFTAAALLPIAVVLDLPAAFVCAFVFEFIVERAGALTGSIIGLLLGVLAASLVGLVPWLAAALSLPYMPSASPIGPHDPSWVLATVIAAAAIAGAVAGACYGTPLRASRPPSEFRWREISIAGSRRNDG